MVRVWRLSLPIPLRVGVSWMICVLSGEWKLSGRYRLALSLQPTKSACIPAQFRLVPCATEFGCFQVSLCAPDSFPLTLL